LIELGPARQPFRIDHSHSSAEMHAALRRIRAPHRLTTTPAGHTARFLDQSPLLRSIPCRQSNPSSLTHGCVSAAVGSRPRTAICSNEGTCRLSPAFCACGCGKPVNSY